MIFLAIEATDWMIYIAAWIIATAATALIFAIVFQMGKQRRLMQAQLEILLMIGAQQGVSPDEMQNAINQVMKG